MAIALTTFGTLALELAPIRWTSSHVRVFAYLNNIVLIYAVLGIGLRVADRRMEQTSAPRVGGQTVPA